MRLGWRTPQVDSLNLAELAYTRIKNALKYARKLSCFLCGCYMYNYWGDRTDTRLCEPF